MGLFNPLHRLDQPPPCAGPARQDLEPVHLCQRLPDGDRGGFPILGRFAGQVPRHRVRAPRHLAHCRTILVHNIGWLVVFHVARKPKSLARDEDRHPRVERIARVVAHTLLSNVTIVAVAYFYPVAALVLAATAKLFYLFAGLFWTSIGGGHLMSGPGADGSAKPAKRSSLLAAAPVRGPAVRHPDATAPPQQAPIARGSRTDHYGP